ncbi:phosphate ABC transporter permease PstA [Kiloniella sp. b19]|uniref:phosphate ABC transporter permease PstA n=1 Tax=Kiloniella sp. GXU_MW_B19 TaxID=3141326 RepID=UPI0031D763A3
MSNQLSVIQKRLVQRRAAEKRFRLYGLMAIALAGLILLTLGTSIVSKGYSAFYQTYMVLDVTLEESRIDPDGQRDVAKLEAVSSSKYRALVRSALQDAFPEVEGRRELRKLFGIAGAGSDRNVKEYVLDNPGEIGTTVRIAMKVSDDVDSYFKGYIDRTLPEDDRRVKDQELAWLDTLEAEGRIETHFNTDFFVNADSREPEDAGIRGALVGSFLTLLVTLTLSFPIGVLTAIYLEEFAPKNRWTDVIEVNINNLAAVPSIVFGLLGLAVFLGVFGLPRSAPFVGGMVLALMTLPTIIIAARAALKAVPPSIREAALGMGASRVQVVFHHVLPLAMPGILTGTILGMAQALGETAPLLMIGMVAFIADIPGSFTDAATVLPVQIFLWADAPERAFVEKTSAAIIIILLFLFAMNALAVLLRKRFERRW